MNSPRRRIYLRQLIASGVDAAIVQDVGSVGCSVRCRRIFRSMRPRRCPLPSAAGLEFAEELGCRLVALARECSLREIHQIQEERTSAAGGSNDRADRPLAPFPLEVFVHGALCVAYSGQCLTSESLGGRSANRGECAQACRLPYELICDGTSSPGRPQVPAEPPGSRGHQANTRADSRRSDIPEDRRTAQSAEYVANITRIYRRAIDQAWSAAAGSQTDLAPECAYAMEMAFSRGLHTGWLDGINHQKTGAWSIWQKRGVYLGEVKRLPGKKSSSISRALETR